MRLLTLLSLYILLIAGCSTFKYSVITTSDEFTGSATKQMSGNFLVKEHPDDDDVRVLFDVCKDLSHNAPEPYFVMVMYLSGDWLFIKEDEPYHLLIDGELMVADEGPYKIRRKVGGYGTVYESFSFYITEDLLIKLANSKNSRLKLRGDDGNVQISFSNTNKKRISEFIGTANFNQEPPKLDDKGEYFPFNPNKK